MKPPNGAAVRAAASAASQACQWAQPAAPLSRARSGRLNL